MLCYVMFTYTVNIVGTTALANMWIEKQIKRSTASKKRVHREIVESFYNCIKANRMVTSKVSIGLFFLHIP
jgi:hypothetical protein